MTRNKRFAFMSMGRLFVPTMANPSGTIDNLSRLQLIYCYPFEGTPPPPAVFPLTVTLTDSAIYSVTLTDK